MILFETIKFGITFVELFCQFVWIERKSHYNSRVSLHEASTKIMVVAFNSRSKTRRQIQTYL